MSVSTMKKLTVLAPEGEADSLVRRLMKLRCVEIRTTPLGEDGELLRNDCDRARVEAERRVAEVTEAIPMLDRYAERTRSWRDKLISTTTGLFRKTGSYDAARSVVKEVLQIKAGMTDCQNDEARTEARIASLRPWLEYDTPLELEETKTCFVRLGVLPAGTLISAVDNALASTSAVVDEVERDESGLYIAVVFHQTEEEAVNRALGELGFLQTNFKDLTGTATEVCIAAKRHLGELDNAMQAYIDRLKVISQLIEDLEVLYDVEMTTLLSAQHRQKLATTGSCVLLEGWIPEGRSDRVLAALGRMECAYELTDPAEGEEPPVLLMNNGYASRFEWVVGMYSYPKYGTFDPTFIMSIFYFVIFGLMFADVGYGVLLILPGFVAPCILPLKDSMKRMLNMFGYCGIACALFGVVFGGWFGDLPYAIMTGFMGYESPEAAKEAVPFFNGLTLRVSGEPLSLNPMENPIIFLVISLVMGAIHLVAGMAVKFCILCKEGKILDAIFDIGSYWVLFAGIGLIFVHTLVGGIVLGVGVLMIVATQGRAQKNVVMKVLMGLKGLYDLIGYASDLLSYSRILALGLAAGVIAQVVNMLATMGGPTVSGFILLVLVMLVGHALNIAINLLGAFVHTSRLQYLEFFGKFYEDGGEPFEPALPSEKYSTAESDIPIRSTTVKNK